MCRFCTKIYTKHKNISKYINDNLFVQITKFIPVQLSYGIITGCEINLFVQSSVCERQKVHETSDNFGCLFYEFINSPFLLCKFYLDILCRVVFNICDNMVFPALLHDTRANCRNYNVCTSSNCFSLTENKVRGILCRQSVKLCKRLAEFSSLSVNPYFIIDVFHTYKRDEDFNNLYLEIERSRNELFLQKS